MLTLDRRWLSSERAGTSRSVRGAIGLAGPYDFLPLRSSALRTIFGPEDRLQATQPINFVSGGEPPMLLITGDADDVVDPANSAHLAARIRAKGGTVEERRYRSLGHVRLVGSLARPLQFLAPTMDDVVSFIASHD